MLRSWRDPPDLPSAPAFPRPQRARLRAVFSALFDQSLASLQARSDAELLTHIDAWSSDPQSVAPAIDTPEEVWERLNSRGMIPDSWMNDPLRAFSPLCTRCHGYQGEWVLRTEDNAPSWERIVCSFCDGIGLAEGATVAPVPPSLRTIVALACSMEAITTAEALYQELLSRLLPLHPDEVPPSAMVWRVLPSSRHLVELPWYLEAHRSFLLPKVRVWDASESTTWELSRLRINNGPPHAQRGLLSVFFRSWTALQHSDACVDDEHLGSEFPFRSLKNPFDPALELLNAGFFLDSFGSYAGLAFVFP